MEASKQPKVGLALSGGGHRAAFFHVGVLARLAELGKLRRVEVISTVSGGSMLGALYYILVKRLLESKPNRTITDGDYLAVVEDLERRYRAGQAANLRGSAFTSYPGNFRLARSDFSRTDRIAELLEELLYRPALGAGEGPIEMQSLKISPLDDDGKPVTDFDPTASQDRMAACVPILLLNSTTLNTGHNWRFEASWVGEPQIDSVADADVDKSVHLLQWKRSALPTLPAKMRTLGTAVAASACFPGGLAPLSIPGLFDVGTADAPQPYTVKLADGGVRDNQGIDGLLDNGCELAYLSDGSLLTGSEANPGTRLPALLARANSIAGRQSREQRVLRAKARMGDDNVKFMHLLSGLPSRLVSPTGATPVPGWPPVPAPDAKPPTGLDDPAQRLVAQMRTDLDAFSDLEASSVMEVGYRAAAREVDPGTAGAVHDWRFHRVAPLLDRPTDDYMLHLRVALRRFGKAGAYRNAGSWRQQAMPILALVVALAAVVGIGFGVYSSQAFAIAAYVVTLLALAGVVLFMKSEANGFKTPARLVFDSWLVFLGALLPLWIVGHMEIRAGKSHMKQGPDGG